MSATVLFTMTWAVVVSQWRERERKRAVATNSGGQSYKASMIVIYKSRVVNISNFLVSTTREL